MTDANLRLYAATSGWEGPFQHEQPVCRTKMRIADLGPVTAGVVAGPLKAGDSLAEAGVPVDLRCGP